MFPGASEANFVRASGDATTVLHFDPVAAKFLVIRQFRHGAFVRRDKKPWCIEPPAGRIDPGETAEEAAHRKLWEETGSNARSLHNIAFYGPTPGAFSKHLKSSVAIAELDGVESLIGGVECETADIMAHILPYSELLEMQANGVANNGPFTMTALWLKAEAVRLASEI